MLLNNISNKSVIQKLKINNLETSLISNSEFNTLNNIDTSQTIQNQINNLIISGSSGNLNNITTTNILINANSNSYPLQINYSTLNVFKISNDGSIYSSNLYINNVLINFSSYITSSYLNTALSYYVSNSALNSALNGYYQKSETWSKADTDNQISIATTSCLSNSKSYTDS